MAKKDKLKTGEFKLDGDLDFDFDDFDAQFSSGTKSKDRSVVTDVFKGTVRGSLDTFKSPSFLAKKLKSVLPNEYGEIFKAADETSYKLSSLYDQTIRDVKPQLGQLANKIDKLVPAESARLKKITGKLTDIFDDNKTFSYEGPSQEDIQNQSINNTLAEIFNAQQAVGNQVEARRRAEDKVNRNIDHKRFTANYGVLSSINENVSRLAQYNSKVNQSFQKKTLELQYRSYFVQSQLLDITGKYYSLFKEQNEALVKNSSLPDAVKLKNSEFYMQRMKGKFADKISDKLFGDQSIFGVAADRLTQQVKAGVDKFKYNLENIVGMVDQVGGALEASEAMGDMGESKGETAGGIIGGLLADMLAEKGIKKYKDKIQDNATIKKYGFKGLDYLLNFSGKMKKMKKDNKFIQDNKYAGGMKGIQANVLDMFFDLFRDPDADFGLKSKQGLGSLKEQSVFDEKAHRSLTEVIPGYLARIYRELIVTRTGNDSTAMPMFDFGSGRFTTNTKLTADIKAVLKDKAKRSSYKYNIDKTFDMIKGDEQVSDKTALKSKLFLSKLSREKMDFNITDIKESEMFQKLDPQTQAFLISRLDKMNDGENKDKNQLALTKSLKDLKDTTPDIRKEIEQYVEAGYADILEDYGIIKTDSSGSIQINEEKYYKIINQSVFSKSDINAKRNISKFDPKQALNKVKNTKIYNWFYKLNKGDQEAKVGPMAQDVNANMGEDVAPDGTKIDLTALNGINMSAIQALQSNQEKLLKQDNNVDILSKIKEDTGRLVELLQVGTFRLALANGEMTIKDVKNYVTGKIGNAYDKLKNLTNTTYRKGRVAARKLNRGVVRPAKEAISDFYDKNKDDAKEAMLSMFSKAGEFAGSVYSFGKDMITNKIPNQINIFKGKAGEFIKDALDILDRPVDLYIKGRNDPVLRAALMEQGMYIDEKTKKVIRSIKDINGTVLDKFGNIIVDAKEMKEGFVNRYGEAVKTRFFRFADAARNMIGSGIGRIRDFAGNAMDFITGKLSGTKEKGQKFFSGLFGMGSSQRIYDVLVEIRDILAGNTKTGAPKGKTIASYIKSAPKESDITQMQHKRIIDTGAIKEKIMGLFGKAKSKFFDKDGDGDRDNSWQDRLSNWKNKTKDKISKKFDDVKTRYKDGNIFDGLFGKISGLFSLLTGGMSGIFNLAGGIFGKLGKVGGLVGKAAGFLGKGVLGAGRLAGGLAWGGAKLAGSAALTAGRFALTLTSLGLSGVGSAAAAMATTALTSIGAILSSPFVLGALAVGVTAYAAYKTYKYLTRNSADKYFNIRLKQYGLVNDSSDKHHVNEINQLEAYMNDNKVRMNGGTPVLLENNIKGEEILEIFSIDPKDTERLETFLKWFHSRFKPFFLAHYAALYAINPKIKFSDIDKTLSKQEKARYLASIGFDSGPYHLTESPFDDITSMYTNKEAIKAEIDKLLEEVKGKDDPVAKKNEAKVKIAKPEENKDKIDTGKTATDTIKKANIVNDKNSKPEGEGDGVNLGSSSTMNDIVNNSASTSAVGNITMAKGPLASGQAAEQYMIFKDGVSLNNLHPSMSRNFKAMVEEYGQLTGKKVTIESAYRSSEQQAKLRAKYGDRAARPGNSLHEFGLAIDASSAALNEMEKLGLMKKYGFTRPVGAEPWHVEPIGIQQDLARAKFDPNFASQAIESSPGRGGGGLGTIAGAKKYSRDKNMALAIFNSGTGTSLAANDSSIGNQSSSPASVASVQSGPVGGQSLNTSPINTNDKAAVVAKIEEVSKTAGVDPNMVKTFAAMESSYNVSAKSGKSSAKGLFGFVNTTWDETIAKHGSKYGLDAESKPTDVAASTAMASEYIKDNIRSISRHRPNPTTADVYMAHLLGPSGANKLFAADKNLIAADLMSRAARNNPEYFFGPNGRKLTVGEVINKFQQRVQTKTAEFGIAAPTNTPVQSTFNAANDASVSAVSSNVTPIIPSTDNQPNILSGFNPAPIGNNTDTMGSNLSKMDLSATNKILTKSLEINQQQLAVLQQILNKIDLEKVIQSMKSGQQQGNARKPDESVIGLNRRVM